MSIGARSNSFESGTSHEWDPPSPSLRRDKLYATNETYVTLSA